MLYGYLEIWQEFRKSFPELSPFEFKVIGMHIHDANPVEAFDLVQCFDESRQGFFAIDIDAIEAGILCDENEFSGAAFSEFFCFGDEVFDGLALNLAADGGDHAISAMVVTSVGDAQIDIVFGV